MERTTLNGLCRNGVFSLPKLCASCPFDVSTPSVEDISRHNKGRGIRARVGGSGGVYRVLRCKRLPLRKKKELVQPCLQVDSQVCELSSHLALSRTPGEADQRNDVVDSTAVSLPERVQKDLSSKNRHLYFDCFAELELGELFPVLTWTTQSKIPCVNCVKWSRFDPVRPPTGLLVT